MSEQKEALRRVLDKLASAGWIKRSALYDVNLNEGTAHGVGIEYTKHGLDRVNCLLSLISEIENVATPMSEDEWQTLKAVAQYSAKASASQGDAGNNPPNR